MNAGQTVARFLMRKPWGNSVGAKVRAATRAPRQKMVQVWVYPTRCVICGTWFEPIREGALTDTVACRLKLSRMLRAGKRPPHVL